MWLEVINEVSEKGTGSKLVLCTSSLNREKISSIWTLMQMAQMDVIRLARWRELGLIGISLHINMFITQ